MAAAVCHLLCHASIHEYEFCLFLLFDTLYKCSCLFVVKGSVKCGPCPFGYTGDGKFCVRSTDQAVPTPGLPISAQRCDSQQNPCHPLATCVQTSYSISCICPPNYSGSGYGIFGCTPSNSTTGGCASSPCLNGGTCINRGLFGYRCECPPNTVSPRCSRPLSVCMPSKLFSNKTKPKNEY